MAAVADEPIEVEKTTFTETAGSEMLRLTLRALAGLLLCLLILVPAAPSLARSVELPTLRAEGARTIVVDAKRGADRNPGTSARPLRTVTAAWESLPAREELERPVRILIRPGSYTARSLPNFWESRWGSRRAPIVIAAAKRGTVRFSSVNLFDVRWIAFDGITFSDRFDLFHCERCQSVLLSRSRLIGSPRELAENVKVNQSRDIGIVSSVISGAGDNAIDFVAVRYGLIKGNRIENAGDWCAYAKGGSAFIRVQSNRIRRCGTGGFTAGQGTGFQFMVAPFIRYEAYGVEVLDNLISDVEGAGVGVNGAFNVVVARNRMWNVGARSHLLEVVYGGRSCDGQPGDEGRERCQANLGAGGWGTTRVDDGSNYVRIPNRHVWILGNVIDNPRALGDQLFTIAGPFSGPEQDGSGLGDVRADEDLTIAGNVIAGRGRPAGVDDCAAPDCRAIASRNKLNAAPGLFRAPARGDLRLARGLRAPSPSLPALRWTDSGGVAP